MNKDKIIEEKDKIIEKLRAELVQVRAERDRVMAINAKLEGRLNQNSNNSSKAAFKRWTKQKAIT